MSWSQVISYFFYIIFILIHYVLKFEELKIFLNRRTAICAYMSIRNINKLVVSLISTRAYLMPCIARAVKARTGLLNTGAALLLRSAARNRYLLKCNFKPCKLIETKNRKQVLLGRKHYKTVWNYNTGAKLNPDTLPPKSLKHRQKLVWSFFSCKTFRQTILITTTKVLGGFFQLLRTVLIASAVYSNDLNHLPSTYNQLATTFHIFIVTLKSALPLEKNFYSFSPYSF